MKVHSDLYALANSASYLLIDIYTQTALLMNAVHKTADSYEARPPDFRLSTTINIPVPYRLAPEMDVGFERGALLKEHERLIGRISTDFLINVVGALDPFTEELFLTLHRAYRGTVVGNEDKLRRLVWRAGGLRDLLAEIKADPPQGTVSLPDLVLDRYAEFRTIRNDILHSRGVVQLKNMRQLQALGEKLVAKPHYGTILDLGVILKDGSINLTDNTVFLLRKWGLEFLGYWPRVTWPNPSTGAGVVE